MELGRHDPCNCGSGKEYESCCAEGVEPRPPSRRAPSPAELKHLGSLFNAGRFAELESQAQTLLELYPDSGFIWELLGMSLQMQGKDSLRAFQKTAEVMPDDAGAQYNLGAVLKIRGRLDEAVESYRRALKLKPDYAEAHSNLGNVLRDLGQLEDAMASYNCALKIKPDSAEIYLNRGVLLSDMGQLDDAVACYRRALELKSNYTDAQSNLLFALNYTAKHTIDDRLAEAYQYGRMVAQKVGARFSTWQCADMPDCLRVGVVSGDLWSHPVGYFLEGMLAQIDRRRIELVAYTTNQKSDDLTARIKSYFSAWKPLHNLSDEAAARMIHADGVHVLLDLAGHTGKNRLPIFAWKPAPVQATWLGYFATTGVGEMDYILGDKWLLPDGEEHHFVEKGWRLSGPLHCLAAPGEDIKVEELPALRNKSFTFGTLNNLTKMNDRVVACWARILNSIPNSQLYLNSKNLRDETLRKKVIERYAVYGIAENRLILDSTTGRVAALNSYNRMDIALDPFPYPGGTTSYEALWMGVPVLTMRGSNYISHLGESTMHNAGLSDWIAVNEEDYITKAIALASDKQQLAALRAGLRQRVLASPLFDAALFASSFETALWGMWHTWRDQT